MLYGWKDECNGVLCPRAAVTKCHEVDGSKNCEINMLSGPCSLKPTEENFSFPLSVI